MSLYISSIFGKDKEEGEERPEEEEREEGEERKREKGDRRKEKGERGKEKGERRKEGGEHITPFDFSGTISSTGRSASYTTFPQFPGASC
jgi:hypothetical protein